MIWKSFFKSLAVSLSVSVLFFHLISPVFSQGNPNPGAIWTTDGSCGTSQQDVNQYDHGDHVFINGENFNAGNFAWAITGQPGNASGDPNIDVSSGVQTVDNTGAFCFDAYTVLPDDCGEYSVKFGTKGDNYHISVACSQLPPTQEGELVCNQINVSPAFLNGNEIDFGQAYQFTADATGSGTLTYSWTLDNLPALDSNSGQSVTWTAPSIANPGTTWNLSVEVSDGTENTDSCQLSFIDPVEQGEPTPTPTATPAPTNAPTSNPPSSGGSSSSSSESSSAQGQVLGASTMAATGRAEDLFAVIFIMASLLTSFGVRRAYAQK